MLGWIWRLNNICISFFNSQTFYDFCRFENRSTITQLKIDRFFFTQKFLSKIYNIQERVFLTFSEFMYKFEFKNDAFSAIIRNLNNFWFYKKTSFFRGLNSQSTIRSVTNIITATAICHKMVKCFKVLI